MSREHTTVIADAATRALTDRVEQRLASLSEDLEPDEVAPSEAARQTCAEMITGAAAAMPEELTFPFPHITTAGVGDLSCEWRGQHRSLILLVAPHGATAIHGFERRHRRAETTLSVPDAPPQGLRDALVQFLSADPVAR